MLSVTLRATYKWVIDELFLSWTPDLSGHNIKDRDKRSLGGWGLGTAALGGTDKNPNIHELAMVWAAIQNSSQLLYAL